MWRRFRAMLRRARLDREFAEEVDFHLAMLEAEFRQRGMSAREARAAARREFGGVARIQEIHRERRGIAWLESCARDVRYALRGLRRSPGFTAAAVLPLALGIGANTAIFSLFHALLMRLLPVARPEELVNLYQTGGWIRGHSSYPLYQDIAARTDLFNGAVARTGVEKVRFRERPEARENFAMREFVSGNYFQVLGVRPALGRLFTADEDQVLGGHPLAVLSYDCWRNRYGGDPAELGATIVVDEKPLTVIGVAAPGFHGIQVERSTDVWEPVTMAEMPFQSPTTWWLQIVARARPEIPRKQLQAAVNVLMEQHLASNLPASFKAAFRKRVMEQRLEVRDAGIGVSMLREAFAKPLRVLMAAVGLVLLMACANVANLLLARGAARRKEIAMRFSLGASRARLVRQALTESFLLAAAGAALGTALGFWGTQAIVRFLPAQAGDPLSAGPDPAVLTFTLAISALSALLFGLVPALRSTAVDPAAGLRSESGGTAGISVLRRALVSAQVAFSVVLVAMAGLFAHSLFELRSVDLGFHDQNVVAFGLDFPRAWRGRDFRPAYKTLAERLRNVPGISSVSYGFPGPFLMGRASATLRVAGSERTAAGPANVATAEVAPGYFATIGTPLVMGREFDQHDTTGAPKVAVVNEAFVRAFLPGDRHPERHALSFKDGEPAWIVGVVRDVRQKGIQEAPEPAVYIPMGQQDLVRGGATMLLRTQLPVASLLPTLYREAAKVGTGWIRNLGTLRDHIDDSIFEQRLLAAIGGFFGVLALVLAAVGLYGVVAYSTAARTGEIGIRIALGAQRGGVVWLILRDALALVAAGLAIGLGGAIAAARAVGTLLFGINPLDPAAFITTALVLAAVGIGAALVPARRAAGLDPMRALRQE